MSSIRVLCLIAAITTAIVSGPAVADEPSSAGNGYLMMVHATFEPNIYNATSGAVPPAPEAAGATNQNGWVVFNVIPHGLNGIATVVSRPELLITATGGTKQIRVLPNGLAQDQAECAIETGSPGFKGPLAACNVFRVPAASLDQMPLVDLVLRFTDGRGPQAEVNSLPGHLSVHAFQGGAPVGLADADATLTGTVTPFAVESLIDPSA